MMKLLFVTSCGMLAVASIIGGTLLSRRPGFKVEGEQAETIKVSAKQSETKAEYLEAKAKFEKGLTEIIAEDVKNTMKDPDSVLLRGTILYHHGEDFGDGMIALKGIYVLCGELNAKNAYGGYVGYRRFASVLDTEVSTGDKRRNPVTLIDDYDLLIGDNDRSRKAHKLFLGLYLEDCK
jgi:hypothetical protein